MGNFTSNLKTKMIYKKNVITDDEIKNSYDAMLLSVLKNLDIGDTMFRGNFASFCNLEFR